MEQEQNPITKSGHTMRNLYVLVGFLIAVVMILVAVVVWLTLQMPEDLGINNSNTSRSDNSMANNETDDDHDHESVDLIEFLQEYDESNDSVRYTIAENEIVIESNGLPDHETGDFPNSGNPNAISEQSYSFRVNRNPVRNSSKSDVKIFGVTIGGVPFDPGTAEKDADTGWAIEAFNSLGNFGLGIDDSNAHVQPSGAYHYHGVPEGLGDFMDDDHHSPLVGFAADGFPIYARYGYSDGFDSAVKEFKSSWQLKSGARKSGEPSGNYDGSYTNDWEFKSGSGDLDECNGIETVTPEYPEGTYAYFLTDTFPYVPRCVYGTADASFSTNDGGPPQGGGQGQLPPQDGQRPPPR